MNIDLKKIKIISAAVLAALVLISSVAVIYLNSVSFLEARLTLLTWYQSPHFTDEKKENATGSILEFSDNGKCVKIANNKKKVWYRESKKEVEWSISEDKTLFFDGKYYEWKDGWSLGIKGLRLDDKIYKNIDSREYRW